MVLLSPSFSNGQSRILKFEHIQTDAGLSQSNVLSILQDSRGFMWFGTRDGLNKYDGYKFTVYRNDPKTPGTISNDYINDIIESRDGNLWIATWGGGLNCFDRQKGNFTYYKYNPKDPKSISSNFITSIQEDKKGNLWIGTESGGLNMMDQKTKIFKHFRNN
ncbi:MAG: two-component regulator propeller domain-containing protein, partial [Ginsengibacter sp.]